MLIKTPQFPTDLLNTILYIKYSRTKISGILKTIFSEIIIEYRKLIRKRIIAVGKQILHI